MERFIVKYVMNIYVMKNGSVVESGNFKNLVEINGEFSKMYKVEIGDKY